MTTPKPGYTVTRNGTEVYDVGAHIERAFEYVASGVMLTVFEIKERGKRDHIPASKDLGMGAIMARLYYSPPAGIKIRRNDEGAVVGYKVNPDRTSPWSDSIGVLEAQGGINMVYYKKSGADDDQLSIQAPACPVQISRVHVKPNPEGGVDVTIDWEPVK